jgi:hypothetical protein
MPEATNSGDQRANSKKKKHQGELEDEIRKPIRPQVIRPQGLATTNRKTIERANAQMEELHEKAVAAARREKLKLLLRRYSLAEDDYEGLALALAIEHEPGFRVDRQIAKLNLQLPVRASDAESAETAESAPAPAGASEIYGPVLIKDGELIDKPRRRPVQWPSLRLLQLLEAVQREKKKSGLTGVTKDLDALGRLARQKQWGPPANHRSKSTRGEVNAWIRTLQSRLGDAKQLKRKVDALVEEAQRRIGK